MSEHDRGGVERGGKRLTGQQQCDETKKVTYSSFVGNAEPVYNPISGDLGFCIYDSRNGGYTIQDHLETPNRILKPHPVLKLYAEKGYAFLPSKPEEYGDTLKLADEIYRYLYKYVDYPDEYRRLDVWYAFFTWIYDRFPVLPYRRALGDTGRGKSRWLKVLGSICRLAFIQGAATSAAPVFRLSDSIRGTQLIDENYFTRKTEAGQAIILILNSGYDKTMGLVSRCVGDSHIPTPFTAFGPKLIASRFPFPDEATENRTITHYAYETDRSDIPTHLGEEFWGESLGLRNKLLLWRFRNLATEFEEDREFLTLKINSRLKEVLSPIAQVTQDKEVKDWLRNLALELNEAISDVRSETPQAGVLSAILALKREGKELQVKNIAEKFKELNPDYPVPPTDKSVGNIIRKDLGLTTKRKQLGRRAPYVVVWNEGQITRLAKAYGLEEKLRETITSLTSITLKKVEGSSANSKSEKEEAAYTDVIDVINVIDIICKWLDKVSVHGREKVSAELYLATLSSLTKGDKVRMKHITHTLLRKGVLRFYEDEKAVTYVPR